MDNNSNHSLIEKLEQAMNVTRPESKAEYNKGWVNGTRNAISIIRTHQQPVAHGDEVLRLIHDMSIAHEMSHAEFCDTAHWNDEFDQKYKAAIAALSEVGNMGVRGADACDTETATMTPATPESLRVIQVMQEVLECCSKYGRDPSVQFVAKQALSEADKFLKGHGHD